MLVRRGSALDLAATYVTLIERTANTKRKNEIIAQMCKCLDNGYTYEEIRFALIEHIHHWKQFSFNRYSAPNKKQEVNLLKQGTMYYHKELKIISSPPVINHDIDSGTMTSNTTEFYVEPVASYTINNLLTYFYSKNMADETEYNPKRMAGIFKHMIDKYGLDKLLFMIEGAARMYEAEHKVFSLSDFDSYNSTASQYLEEIKNNCKYSGSDKYVSRKRVLSC